jgi:acetyl esterase/lipase
LLLPLLALHVPPTTTHATLPLQHTFYYYQNAITTPPTYYHYYCCIFGKFIGWLTQSPAPLSPADVLAQGIAFISADYRLLFPCTAHDILVDVRTLFAFIGEQLNPALSSSSYPGDPFNFHISPDHLAVAGASAGAYPARLAALYANPKPKCFFSLYGTGGNLLDPFYLRTPDAAQGDLDIGTNARFMSPGGLEARDTVAPIADCPMGFDDTTRSIPGYADRLLTLYVTLLKSGRYLDFLTGVEGLGQRLRTAAIRSGVPVNDESYDWERIVDAIPPEANCLFPQLHISNTFPPSYLIHGNQDRAVPVSETTECDRMLREAGVRSEMVIANGLGHTFDQHMGSDGWQRYAGGVVPFLLEYIATEGMETESADGR